MCLFSINSSIVNILHDFITKETGLLDDFDRCFIFLVSTDEKKVMELQTMEGVKEVRPVCDEYGICRAVITDKPKEEEEAMIK